MSDIIRVLRIYEFVGPRDVVEEQISRSIHGERRFPNRSLVIRAATIGNHAEILGAEEASDYNLRVYMCGSIDPETPAFAGPFSFLEDALDFQPSDTQAKNGAYIYRIEAGDKSDNTRRVFWYNRAVNAWQPERG